jgi:serine/threonine protein kinase
LTPELWRKVDELYRAARERGRDALADADPEVRREVEARLEQDTAVVSAGMLLGPYRIEASIGRGGMGEVWKARDMRLGRDVAIKVAHQNFDARFET